MRIRQEERDINKLPIPDKFAILDEFELKVADKIAEELKLMGSTNAGLVIWKTCRRYGVDHHRIALHLSYRGQKKKLLLRK